MVALFRIHGFSYGGYGVLMSWLREKRKMERGKRKKERSEGLKVIKKN